MGLLRMVGVAVALIAASITARESLGEADPAPTETRAGEVETIVHDPPGDAPSRGPRFAPVTIELFGDLSDYTTTYRAVQRLDELAARHPKRLRIVYRLVKRARSEYAEAALEAFRQGKFAPFLKEFYGLRRKTPPVSELKAISESSGVDFAEVEKAWNDDRHLQTITENHWRQRRFGVVRTPSIVVNARPITSMPRDIDALEAIYDDAYAAAMTELSEGTPLSSLYTFYLSERVHSLQVPRIGMAPVDGPRVDSRSDLALINGLDLQGAVDYSGPFSRGASDAAAQVVVYCAMGTRHCNSVASMLDNLTAAYGQELRIVYKPVESGLEDEELESARRVRVAATCAAEQDMFWEFLERVHARGRKQLPRADRVARYIEDKVGRTGVNLPRFEVCMETAAAAGATEAASPWALEARAVGVKRVPSIVVGGRLYVGALSFLNLSALIDLELAPGILERLLD